MSKKPPPARCDDESTWRHKGEKIDLPRLLQLIEENGGPRDLDLHGSDMSAIDASPEALRPYVDRYRNGQGPHAKPPWSTPWATIDLTGVHLEAAVLISAQLQNASLQGAHLQLAELPNAHLEQANLAGAQLEHANLRRAHLEGAYLLLAQLQRARLESADLQNAKLLAASLEGASLWSAHLENAVLLRANLRNVSLQHAYLERASFLGSRLDGALWYGVNLDRTRIRRESLGQSIGDELGAKWHTARSALPFRFHEAREAYMALKTNFDSIGRHDDASWAYVKEQQMQKAMYFPTTAGHTWITERMGGAVPPPWRGLTRLARWLSWKLRSAFCHAQLFFSSLGLCPREVRQEMARRDEQRQERDEWFSWWRWARNWAYELVTGYGERPILPLLWAAVVSLLAFPLLYWAVGALRGHGAAFTSATPSDIDWAGWGDSIIFSLTSFGTVAFNRLQPESTLANILAAFEAFTGVLAFALFVFTLGNRMRRS